MPETIGPQLQKARLERGLTIDQAARVLHIRPNYLVALEEDRRKDLPSPVQGKGFLRMYADYLGLPLQPLLDAWDGKIQAPPPQVEAQPQPEVIPEIVEEPQSAVEPQKIAPVEPVRPEAIQLNTTENPNPEPAGSAFVDIGNRLKRQRKALGLSLPEVERYTHVRQHYLEALEEGVIENMPSPVQGRGMLSNYAHFLNLDVEGLLLEYAEGLQTRREARVAREQPRQKTGPRPISPSTQPKPVKRRLFAPNLLFASLVVLVILGFAIWTAAQVDAFNNSRNGTPTPPSIADVLLSNPLATPFATNTSTPPPPTKGAASNSMIGGAATTNTAEPDLELTVPVNGKSPIQVYVVARERAFVRVTVDDKVVLNDRVVPGNAYPFSGEKKIELLTGSAAAIQVFFNQKDLGVLGVVGQVKSIIFTKDGAVTPTPQFTATPTRTTEPSSTSRPSPTLATPTITPYVP